jgi:signal peptidase II
VNPRQRIDGPAADDRSAADLGRRRTGLLAVIAGVVLLLDVVSKVVAVATLQDHPPVRLFGGLLYLVHFRNSGAAFSLATGLTWLLSLIALGVVVMIVRLAPRLRSPSWAVGLGLVLGGAMGNLVDRMLRAPGPLRGHVVDFLSLLAPDGSVWPVFNLADSAIVCGGVLMVLLAATGREFDGTRSGRRAGLHDE